jgi:hypothetical protein
MKWSWCGNFWNNPHITLRKIRYFFEIWKKDPQIHTDTVWQRLRWFLLLADWKFPESWNSNSGNDNPTLKAKQNRECSRNFSHCESNYVERRQYSDWPRAGWPRGRSPSPGRVKTFLFSMTSRPALGPTQPHIQWVPRTLSPGVKRPGREADHSPITCAEVKKI